MNALQTELTKLIGSKEFTFWCLISEKKYSRKKDKIETTNSIHKVLFKKDYFDSQYTQKVKWVFLCVGVLYDWYETTAKIYELNTNKTDDSDFEIIGHPPQLSDFHKWILSKWFFFKQEKNSIIVMTVKFWENGNLDNFLKDPSWFWNEISYDASKDLLSQEESTLEQIISLIKSVW
jgi:hypothetical protein